MYSGHGVTALRNYLNTQRALNSAGSDSNSTQQDSDSSTSSITLPAPPSPPSPPRRHHHSHSTHRVDRRLSVPAFRETGRRVQRGSIGLPSGSGAGLEYRDRSHAGSDIGSMTRAGSGSGAGAGNSGAGSTGFPGAAFATTTPNFLLPPAVFHDLRSSPRTVLAPGPRGSRAQEEPNRHIGPGVENLARRRVSEVSSVPREMPGAFNPRRAEGMVHRERRERPAGPRAAGEGRVDGTEIAAPRGERTYGQGFSSPRIGSQGSGTVPASNHTSGPQPSWDFPSLAPISSPVNIAAHHQTNQTGLARGARQRAESHTPGYITRPQSISGEGIARTVPEGRGRSGSDLIGLRSSPLRWVADIVGWGGLGGAGSGETGLGQDTEARNRGRGAGDEVGPMGERRP